MEENILFLLEKILLLNSLIEFQNDKFNLNESSKNDKEMIKRSKMVSSNINEEDYNSV